MIFCFLRCSWLCDCTPGHRSRREALCLAMREGDGNLVSERPAAAGLLSWCSLSKLPWTKCWTVHKMCTESICGMINSTRSDDDQLTSHTCLPVHQLVNKLQPVYYDGHFGDLRGRGDRISHVRDSQAGLAPLELFTKVRAAA